MVQKISPKNVSSNLDSFIDITFNGTKLTDLEMIKIKVGDQIVDFDVLN